MLGYMKQIRKLSQKLKSHSQFKLILLIVLVTSILFLLIPSIALKHGATGDGFLGYFGAIIGGSIGALVAAWGIITTIKENRRQAVSPCLIFQEISEFPDNANISGT